MAIIESVRTLPRMKKRTEIVADGEVWGVIDSSLVRKADLQPGSELTPRQWQELLDREIPLALDSTLYYLELRARSEREVLDWMARRRYAPRVQAAVMERITGYGFVDDGALSQRMVESLSRQKMGRGAIERKLRQRGVDKDIAREAITRYDPQLEEDSAREAAQRLWQKYSGDERARRRQKTAAALARRGFSWDSIRSALGSLETGEDEIWQ